MELSRTYLEGLGDCITGARSFIPLVTLDFDAVLLSRDPI